jgi:hypothetical protein
MEPRTPMCLSFVALLLTITLGMRTRAVGWDDQGHMSVAYIAYQQLTPTTKARVKALLALNPYASDPEKWPKLLAKGPAGEDVDEMTLMIAATWPDAIRRDKTYHSDGPQRGDRPPTDGTASNNSGYDDHALHKYWHFVDIPFSTTGATLPSIPTPNAQDRIAAFRGVLTSNEPDAVKSYDLVWLLHLVGDVHQPLHCATRVTASDKDGDAGGNAVKLTTCGSCALHAFWDQALGTSTSLKTVIDKAKTIRKAKGAATSNLNEADWVEESFAAAKKTAYKNPPIGAGHGPFTPTKGYRTAAGSLAEKRIAVAGARLAKVLNADLK